ncbi:MAG TPA: site-2 protease family protein [Candidatus Absconditabacterales bacterium]|nr:site-2 protease family protein [Candidatus Absconditabacterales bacterium]
MFGLSIVEIISLAIILLVSIGMHEYAHAYISYRLGDPTPKIQGRLTTNPLKHMDPIGFFMIFLIGFGWGKPVQVNPMYYKEPVKGELMVALAGPAMNFILATGGVIFLLIFAKIFGMGINDIFLSQQNWFIMFWIQFSIVNIILAIFNLIPIPPLDGFRLVKMISYKFATFVEKYTLYISIFFLILILGPARGGVGNFLWTVSNSIFQFIFTIFANVFY